MRTPPNTFSQVHHNPTPSSGLTGPSSAQPAGPTSNCYAYRSSGYGASANNPYIPSPYVTPPAGTGTGTDFYAPYAPVTHTSFLNFGAGVSPPSCQITAGSMVGTPSTPAYHHHAYHHHHHQLTGSAAAAAAQSHVNSHATFVQNSPPYASHITNIMNFGTAPTFASNPLV